MPRDLVRGGRVGRRRRRHDRERAAEVGADAIISGEDEAEKHFVMRDAAAAARPGEAGERWPSGWAPHDLDRIDGDARRHVRRRAQLRQRDGLARQTPVAVDGGAAIELGGAHSERDGEARGQRRQLVTRRRRIREGDAVPFADAVGAVGARLEVVSRDGEGHVRHALRRHGRLPRHSDGRRAPRAHRRRDADGGRVSGGEGRWRRELGVNRRRRLESWHRHLERFRRPRPRRRQRDGVGKAARAHADNDRAAEQFSADGRLEANRRAAAAKGGHLGGGHGAIVDAPLARVSPRRRGTAYFALEGGDGSAERRAHPNLPGDQPRPRAPRAQQLRLDQHRQRERATRRREGFGALTVVH